MALIPKNDLVFSVSTTPLAETIGKKNMKNLCTSSVFADVLRETLEDSPFLKTSTEKEAHIKTELRQRMISTMMEHIDGKSEAIRQIQYFSTRFNTASIYSTPSNNRRFDETIEEKRSIAPAIEELINRASERFGVDPALIRGVIKVESNFNPHATSPKGAMGLMQLMPDTARELGVTDPYDPEENIMAGTMYLRRLLDRYDGDVEKSLAAYNWGMGNVEKHAIRMPAETVEYVQRVIRFYEQNKA